MATVILGPPPQEVNALIERRRRYGQDSHDEMWEGSYHMAPHAHSRHGWLESQVQFVMLPIVRSRGLALTGGFNLGEDDQSFRVPDFGVHRQRPDALYVPTALIGGEILSLSPGDETYAKMPYYRDHGVEELFVVDADRREISGYRLFDGVIVTTSSVLDVALADIAARIDW